MVTSSASDIRRRPHQAHWRPAKKILGADFAISRGRNGDDCQKFRRFRILDIRNLRSADRFQGLIGRSATRLPWRKFEFKIDL